MIPPVTRSESHGVFPWDAGMALFEDGRGGIGGFFWQSPSESFCQQSISQVNAPISGKFGGQLWFYALEDC